MGSDKEINNNVLDDDALETVAGGMGDVDNLVYTKKTEKTFTSARMDNKVKTKKTNLVQIDKKSAKNGSKLFSGDVIDKGTYC